MNKLKQLREEKQFSQKYIADSIGITTSYYGMLELGTRLPSLPIASKLARFFNAPIEEIFFALKNN